MARRRLPEDHPYNGERLREEWIQSNMGMTQFAAVNGLDYERMRSAIKNATKRAEKANLPQSTYPIFNQPLEMFGDALVLPDLELPFHHAEFVNRVIDLAIAWDIYQCIVAGDALHFATLSKWTPSWTKQAKAGGLDDKQEAALMDFIRSLPSKDQARGMDLVTQIGKPEDPLEDEISVAKRLLKTLGDLFWRVDYVMGNHEGRFLAAINAPVVAEDFRDYLDINNPKWRIAPYYYSLLHSGDRTFRVVHPRGAGDAAAKQLAAKYHQDILMGHSHKWVMETDISGDYYAIQMGCCVDERRLAYAAQRDAAGRGHRLGAVIVRDGRPYLLDQNTDWERMAKL